jgi:type IV pilus assembly protein PilO
MALLPENQKDQAKVLVGFVAVALAAVYYMYPYTTRETEIEAERAHIEALEATNRKAAREFASGSLEVLRVEAAQNRSALTVFRRLIPTANEVPALLEEVSTAARRAGLDVGGVVPEPVIAGRQFDTYRYTVTMIGGYHQVGQFLANVGSLPRIVAPVSVSVLNGGQGNNPNRPRGALASTITLQTYVERGQDRQPSAGGGPP